MNSVIGAPSSQSTPIAIQLPEESREDLFSNLDPRYEAYRMPGEEGNVTNSLSMLTAMPEVGLGMEYASPNFSLVSYTYA